MKRYEVRRIRDNYQQNGQEIQPLDKPMFATNDASEAKAKADSEGSSHYYGVAIVDHQAGTVDWGDEITRLRGDVTVGELRCRIELW